MTNTVAVILGVVVLAAIATDLAVNGGQAMMFLVKKFADMVEWLAFWR